jgi:aminoglycoside 2''-phosphotransferase
MSKKALLGRIRKEYPNLRWKKSKYLAHGWEHDVIILDNHWVFRFPKEQVLYKDSYFQREPALLSYLQTHLSLPIPQYRLLAKDLSFGGYAIVSGVPLTRWVYQRKVRGMYKENIAKELANFLSELHSIPITVADKFHIQTSDRRRAYAKLHEDAQRFLYPKFSIDEKQAAEDFFEKLKQTLSHSYRKVLVHHDLIGQHIFVHRNFKKLSGIIDFSDMDIDDPAIDFWGLWQYGPQFVKTVFKYYRGEKDDHLLERALWYSKRVPLWDMINPFNYGRGSFEEGYRAFRKMFLNAN